jgi:hypothetical protein
MGCGRTYGLRDEPCAGWDPCAGWEPCAVSPGLWRRPWAATTARGLPTRPRSAGAATPRCSGCRRPLERVRGAGAKRATRRWAGRRRPVGPGGWWDRIGGSAGGSGVRRQSQRPSTCGLVEVARSRWESPGVREAGSWECARYRLGGRVTHQRCRTFAMSRSELGGGEPPGRNGVSVRRSQVACGACALGDGQENATVSVLPGSEGAWSERTECRESLNAVGAKGLATG